MRKSLYIFTSLLLLASCGTRRGSQSETPAQRTFPRAEVPSIYTDSDSRLQWAATHYWDLFLDTSKAVNDTLNGLSMDALEQEMGTYTTMLNMLPVKDGQAAVEHFFRSLESFQKAKSKSTLFKHLSDLTERYLYDPNSPVRNEDLFLPFLKGLSESQFTLPQYRDYYKWQAKMCSLNSVGTAAADFIYIDTESKKHRLYDIEAEYLVLIFGNPDCGACQELMEAMSAVPEVVDLQLSGKLVVADIYIDEDVDAWKAKKGEYPPSWINGYDPGQKIRRETLYHVPAIPSIYLLDASKTVLLKDTPQERLLEYLRGV